jgi:radical SAM superfamily enzyme YgiQ (UPF0313 family)
MQYVGNVIRPPSEADSIILQVTVGCTHNKCTFCGAYKDVRFSIKDEQTVDADLDFASHYCRRAKRLFLADGDVLALSQRRLTSLFAKIHHKLPWIKRISLYGNARAVRHKSLAQLQELKELGLDRVYLGLESGCNEVLAYVGKGETAQSMIDAAEKVNAAGLFLSVTVLLGLGGTDRSRQHIEKTAATLNRMKPRQVAALTLMVLANTSLGEEVQAERFIVAEPEQILAELYQLVSRLDTRCQFHANHASSYLPIGGRLPHDRDRILYEISQALSGTMPLVPEYRRAL